MCVCCQPDTLPCLMAHIIPQSLRRSQRGIRHPYHRHSPNHTSAILSSPLTDSTKWCSRPRLRTRAYLHHQQTTCNDNQLYHPKTSRLWRGAHPTRAHALLRPRPSAHRPNLPHTDATRTTTHHTHPPSSYTHIHAHIYTNPHTSPMHIIKRHTRE